MTYPQSYYLDPSIKMERDQERNLNQECNGCVHHSRLWGVRVCKKHEGQLGTQLKRCDDYKVSLQEVRNQLKECFKR